MHLMTPKVMLREYTQLLSYVIHADGVVDSEEWIDLVSDIAAIHPNLTPEFLEQCMKNPETFEVLIKRADNVTLRAAVRDGMYIAAVDGRVDISERKILLAISKAANLSKTDFEKIEEWVEIGLDWVKQGYELVEEKRRLK